MSDQDKPNTPPDLDAAVPSLRFAELLLQRGVSVLVEEQKKQEAAEAEQTEPSSAGSDAASDSGSDADEAPVAPVDVLARRLALAASLEPPLVTLSEDGERSDVFAGAQALMTGDATDRALMLMDLIQTERAVMFEFDGTGPLTGNRVVAAVLRPEARFDLVESWIAIGRLRDGTVQMTVAPAVLRFDAANLAMTLSMIASAGRPSVNAANAAMGHASRITPLADLSGTGQTPDALPNSVIDLFWHAIALTAMRGRDQQATRTLH